MQDILESALWVTCTLPENFNSDAFGTFTQDIKRHWDMLEAARAKAAKSMDMTWNDLAIASEGSFGMHPSIPFIPSNLELVVLIDRKNNLEMRGQYRSSDTNLDGKYVESIEEALAFADKIWFPSHGVILRRKQNKKLLLNKDITSKTELISGVKKILSMPLTSKVFIETDMRAHKNPTRMKAIKKATENLIDNIQSKYPTYQTPWFVVANTSWFLPSKVTLNIHHV